MNNHFHTNLDTWKEKVDSAFKMDVEDLILLIKGLGGCPMAQDDLTGNMATERLVSHFSDNLDLNIEEFNKSLQLSESVF